MYTCLLMIVGVVPEMEMSNLIEPPTVEVGPEVPTDEIVVVANSTNASGEGVGLRGVIFIVPQRISEPMGTRVVASASITIIPVVVPRSITMVTALTVANDRRIKVVVSNFFILINLCKY